VGIRKDPIPSLAHPHTEIIVAGLDQNPKGTAKLSFSIKVKAQ